MPTGGHEDGSLNTMRVEAELCTPYVFDGYIYIQFNSGINVLQQIRGLQIQRLTRSLMSAPATETDGPGP